MHSLSNDVSVLNINTKEVNDSPVRPADTDNEYYTSDDSYREDSFLVKVSSSDGS